MPSKAGKKRGNLAVDIVFRLHKLLVIWTFPHIKQELSTLSTAFSTRVAQKNPGFSGKNKKNSTALHRAVEKCEFTEYEIHTAHRRRRSGDFFRHRGG